jgi:hypothetical protein
MKTGVIRFNRQRIILALFMTIFLLFSFISRAQMPKEISFSVYPGYTFVNFEKALDYSDDYMENWSNFQFAAAIRGFLQSEKQIQLGAELAWQKLYYTYYILPYGPSPVYREFNVTTVSLMALGRYSVNRFFAVGGVGIHFFNSGVSAAICFESGYVINAGANLKFPLSFRINPIFGSGMPTPISVGAGVSFTIR